MSKNRGGSPLSRDNDLETDLIPLQPAKPVKLTSMKRPGKLAEDSNLSLDNVFDSGISSMVTTSYTDTTSESLDNLSKTDAITSLSGLCRDMRQVSLTDEGIGSITASIHDSLKENVEFSESKRGDKIVPETSKNLSVEATTKEEDAGYGSYRSQSTGSTSGIIGNINESEVDLEELLAEPDEDGDTIVHTAIVSRNEGIALTLIDVLISRSRTLDMVNKLFQTVLHLAVLTEQRKIVQKLVAKGCDLTVRDQQGNTALHIACRKGREDLVKDMVASLADDPTKRKELFSIRNCEGLTCLHLAAQGKHYEVMGYLFAKGADVNIGDGKSGRTILHYAVERKDVETVVLLLTHPSIDIDCETYKGETPLLLAYWRNYQDIVKRLKANGAFFSYDLVENEDDGDDS